MYEVLTQSLSKTQNQRHLAFQKIRTTAKAIDQLLESICSEFGINHRSLSILASLEEASGLPLHSDTLFNPMEIQKSDFDYSIEQLIENELIYHGFSHLGKHVQYGITQEGIILLKKLNRQIEAELFPFYNNLKENEAKLLNHLLDKVIFLTKA